MRGNIANGGLLTVWRGDIIFAHPNEWFLNADDEFIYYSDRNNDNRLCRKCGVNDTGKVITKEPCSNVVIFGDGIYYVNEDDMKVYRCSKEGKGRTLWSDEKTAEFALLDDGSVYINPNARRLCIYGSRVYFADAGNGFVLTCYDTKSKETEAFPDIKPSFINVYGDDVYYTDRMRENKIYSLSSRFSIYGGNAECLHVADGWLYFLSDKKWKRLSLSNFGEEEEV